MNRRQLLKAAVSLPLLSAIPEIGYANPRNGAITSVYGLSLEEALARTQLMIRDKRIVMHSNPVTRGAFAKALWPHEAGLSSFSGGNKIPPITAG